MSSEFMSHRISNLGTLAVLTLLCWGGSACKSSDSRTPNGQPANADLPYAAAAGLDVFERLACDTCHALNNSRFKAGPPLNDIFGKEVQLVGGTKLVRDEEYLKNSILDAGAQIVQGYRPQMINYGNLLQEGELESLIALIRHYSEATPDSTKE